MAKILEFYNAYVQPTTDDAYDLGAASKEFKNLYIDGIAYIDSIGESILFADNISFTFGTGTGIKVATATNQKLAFYNVTPVVQQAALTVNVGTVTFSEPTTPDYAIASLTSVDGFGFASLDEGHSILKVIANLQTRVDELSSRLTTYGLLSS